VPPTSAALPLAAVLLLTAEQVLNRAKAAWFAWTLPEPVPQSLPVIAAHAPVPKLKATGAWEIVAHRISGRLPAGAVFAASEVGQIGGYAPYVTIIDTAGLNDREIGLHGFSADRLMERASDLIWLSHNDYTGAHAALFASAAFPQHYRLLVGAFDYGLAIKVDGPRADAVAKVVSEAWRETYPELDQRDYVAQWPSPVQASAALTGP
jgi:hypothetical protein